MIKLNAKRTNREIYNETAKNSAVKAAVAMAEKGQNNSQKGSKVSRRTIRSGVGNVVIEENGKVVVPENKLIDPYVDYDIPMGKYYLKLSCFGGTEEILKGLIGKKVGAYVELKTKKVGNNIYPYIRIQVIPGVIFDKDLLITNETDMAKAIDAELPNLHYSIIQNFYFGFVDAQQSRTEVAAA